MAESNDDSAFWLPSEFLTDDDFLDAPKEKPTSDNGGFGDPDEFVAELTRHLAQSMTLNSANRRLTTVPAPTNGGAWDFYRAAAARAARTRALNHQACNGYPTATYNGSPTPFERRTPIVCYNASQSNQFQQISGGGVCGACRASLAPTQSAWPQRPQLQSSRLSHVCAGGCHGGGFLGGPGSAGGKRQSTGTGVFLPRRVGNSPAPEPRKKQGYSTVLLPARVVQALNLNMRDLNGHNAKPCLVTNHDLLLARRNAILAQQRRLMRRAEGQIGQHEVPLLPQEWTY